MPLNLQPVPCPPSFVLTVIKECTKRRAAISVMSHLAAYEATPQSNEARRLEANRIVNEVWDSCWKDTRPFDEVGSSAG